VQFADGAMRLTAVTTTMQCSDKSRADMSHFDDDEVLESMDVAVPAAARTAQGVNR
jgi:hypothetical protein